MGMAIDALPNYNNRGGATWVSSEVDQCNVHSGKGDDYHYHGDLYCTSASTVVLFGLGCCSSYSMLNWLLVQAPGPKKGFLAPSFCPQFLNSKGLIFGRDL